jgi:hypothetical protein
MKPILVAVSLPIVMCLNAGNAFAAASSTKSDMSGMEMDKGTSMPGMPGMQTNQAAPMQGMPGMQMNQAAPMQGMPGIQMPGSSDAKPALRPEGHLEINDVADGGKDLKTYSLQDLQNLATNNNPTLVQARSQVKGEKGKALQAGIWPNPQAGYVGDLMGAPGAGLGEFQGGVTIG